MAGPCQREGSWAVTQQTRGRGLVLPACPKSAPAVCAGGALAAAGVQVQVAGPARDKPRPGRWRRRVLLARRGGPGCELAWPRERAASSKEDPLCAAGATHGRPRERAAEGAGLPPSPRGSGRAAEGDRGGAVPSRRDPFPLGRKLGPPEAPPQQYGREGSAAGREGPSRAEGLAGGRRTR